MVVKLILRDRCGESQQELKLQQVATHFKRALLCTYRFRENNMNQLRTFSVIFPTTHFVPNIIGTEETYSPLSRVKIKFSRPLNHWKWTALTAPQRSDGLNKIFLRFGSAAPASQCIRTATVNLGYARRSVVARRGRVCTDWIAKLTKKSPIALQES